MSAAASVVKRPVHRTGLGPRRQMHIKPSPEACQQRRTAPNKDCTRSAATTCRTRKNQRSSHQHSAVAESRRCSATRFSRRPQPHGYRGSGPHRLPCPGSDRKGLFPSCSRICPLCSAHRRVRAGVPQARPSAYRAHIWRAARARFRQKNESIPTSIGQPQPTGAHLEHR
jgi:hypothetical protein